MTKMEKNCLCWFAKAFREARKNVGFTQEQLAAIIGCSVNSLNGWENGRSFPERSKWEVIQRELDLNVKDFYKKCHNVGETAFCERLFELRMSANVSRSTISRDVLGGKDLKDFESGKTIPTNKQLTKLEAYFDNIKDSEYLRPAWEEEVKKYPKEDQEYFLGNLSCRPKREKKKERTADAVEEAAAAPAAPSVDTTLVSNESKPVVKQEKIQALRCVPVWIQRVLKRAETSGYESSLTANIIEFLQKFATIVVCEHDNIVNGRNYLEIPWPMPLELGQKHHQFIWREDEDMCFTYDILDFDWDKYAREHGLCAKVVMNQDEEDGFFNK